MVIFCLDILNVIHTVNPKKYARGFCFAVLCCGYTMTDFPISIRLTSLALWQCKDCPSAGKATLTNMDKYFMWIHYERLHNHNKAKHNKTVCIFLGIYCMTTCGAVACPGQKLLPWLLMLWLLMMSFHQQSWHLLCKIVASCYQQRKKPTAYVISVLWNDIKCK